MKRKQTFTINTKKVACVVIIGVLVLTSIAFFEKGYAVSTCSSYQDQSNTQSIKRIPLFSLTPDSYSLEICPSASAGSVLSRYQENTLELISQAKLNIEKNENIIELSLNEATFIQDSFIFMFSVDRQTLGIVMPDPELTQAGYKHNACDQALYGQAAGDAFVSTIIFTKTGPLLSQNAPPIFNNVLSVNNFDEGGTSFIAKPPIQRKFYQPSADDEYLTPQTTDDIDGLANTRGVDKENIFPLYYITSNKPAEIAVLSSKGKITTYATKEQLGLKNGDVVDGLVVFDQNNNILFDAGDQLLISLAPGSPSLLKLSKNRIGAAAADVFSITIQNKNPIITLFAPARYLGLGAPHDNIDALTCIPITSNEKGEFDLLQFMDVWGIPQHI